MSFHLTKDAKALYRRLESVADAFDEIDELVRLHQHRLDVDEVSTGNGDLLVRVNNLRGNYA